jgi:hypothetical protein
VDGRGADALGGAAAFGVGGALGGAGAFVAPDAGAPVAGMDGDCPQAAGMVSWPPRKTSVASAVDRVVRVIMSVIASSTTNRLRLAPSRIAVRSPTDRRDRGYLGVRLLRSQSR